MTRNNSGKIITLNKKKEKIRTTAGLDKLYNHLKDISYQDYYEHTNNSSISTPLSDINPDFSNESMNEPITT